MEYNPSRVVGANNGPRRDQTEQMLLEYVNSDQFATTNAWDSTFLTQLVRAFGQLPRHVSLRHATYALAASYHPQKQCQEQFEYHAKLALRTLERKINNPAQIVEQDFFGAALIIYALAAYRNWDEGLVAVAKRFVFLFCQLSENPELRHQSDLFIKFGAAAVDTVADTVCVSDPFSGPLAILCRCMTTFEQRVVYESMCRQLSRTPEAWQSDVAESIFYTVMHSAWLILNCLGNVAKKEFRRDPVRRESIESVVESIGGKLSDPVFLNAIRSKEKRPYPGEVLTDEEILIAHSVLGVRGIRQLIKLLKAHTISEALGEVDTFSAWAELIRACLQSKHIIPDTFPINHYPQVTYWPNNYLLLGGCMLPASQYPQ